MDILKLMIFFLFLLSANSNTYVQFHIVQATVCLSNNLLDDKAIKLQTVALLSDAAMKVQ